MSFFEQRLDPKISFGATGGPVFSTEVNSSVGGQRFANRNWLYPLHRYDITQGVKSNADFEQVRALFYNVAGQFDGFRYKDWADFQATLQPLTLVSGNVYQATRVYVLGVRSYTRPVYKLVSGTPVVYRTRSGSTSSISPSIDLNTGLITVSGHLSGDTYTWSGEFDVPVAFTSDVMQLQIVNKNGGGFLVTWPSIQLQEIRP